MQSLIISRFTLKWIKISNNLEYFQPIETRIEFSLELMTHEREALTCREQSQQPTPEKPFAEV